MEDRACLPSRVVDSDFVEPYITTYLRRIGWENWIDAPETIHYPTYAKEFYDNLKLIYRNNDTDDPLLTSTVRSVPIQLSRQDFADIFNIPNEGGCIYFKKTWKENYLRTSMATCHGTMLTRFVPGKVKTSLLKSEFKCLYTYVRANIFPVGGHNDEISSYALFIMYCMVVGRQLNLPYIIISLMHYITTIENKDYLYTSMLNKIFRHNNVRFSNYDSAKGGSRIDRRTLRMYAMQPVAAHPPTQAMTANYSGETSNNEFVQPHEDVFQPMSPEEQNYYPTQELNSDFDFINRTEGYSVPSAARQSYDPSHWTWPKQ